MPKSNNHDKFLNLRSEFPVFIYEGYDFQWSDNGLMIRFNFNLSDRYFFHPILNLPAKDFFSREIISHPILDNIIFHIGLIELVSYWKAACPPIIIVKNHSLTDAQVRWWKKLYFNGLAEFFYLNSISVTMDDFVDIQSDFHEYFKSIDIPFLHESVIIPVGGGKDSAVTLELLSKQAGNLPLIINPRPASTGTARINNYDPRAIIEVYRTIDPVLLKLNDEGFLNGHTPFSALLAFVSLLSAVMTGNKYIALSNESSANEATSVIDQVNHQYSKSFEFEKDFRDYVRNYISRDIEYFSFLRPLNELQIARIFAGNPQYFKIFKSCNAGSKKDSWCGKCPKCLFTYIILSPFLEQTILKEIFGKNLLDDPDLLQVMNELTGIAETKPFDCIGTLEEVNLTLAHLIREIPAPELPFLLRYYSETPQYIKFQTSGIDALLDSFDKNHFLPEKFEILLKSAIHGRADQE